MSKGVEVYAEIDHDGSHKKERLCEKSLGIMREKERLEKKKFPGYRQGRNVVVLYNTDYTRRDVV